MTTTMASSTPTWGKRLCFGSVVMVVVVVVELQAESVYAWASHAPEGPSNVSSERWCMIVAASAVVCDWWQALLTEAGCGC